MFHFSVMSQKKKGRSLSGDQYFKYNHNLKTIFMPSFYSQIVSSAGKNQTQIWLAYTGLLSLEYVLCHNNGCLQPTQEICLDTVIPFFDLAVGWLIYYAVWEI